MRWPNMTLRRWFWAATLGALAWWVLALKFGGRDETKPTAGQTVERGVAGTSAQMLLTPISAPVGWLQTRAEQLAAGDRSLSEPKGMEELRQYARSTENENWRLRDEIQRLDERLKVYEQATRLPGLRGEDIILANVTGRGVDAHVETIGIDKGTGDGVKVGQVVMAENAPVGRVIAVSATGAPAATVRLVTDPDDRQMRVNAQLVRWTPLGPKQIVESCQVRGAGSGMLACDVPALGELPPQKGDLLIVRDVDWRPLLGVPVGEVVMVKPLDHARQRYDLVVKPRVKVGTLTQVQVIKK